MWKIISTRRFWIKLIWVRGRTSIQFHRFRNEYHFGIRKAKLYLKFVPRGFVHRLDRGIYIEIATGKPLEEDIIRLEDDYGRI